MLTLTFGRLQTFSVENLKLPDASKTKATNDSHVMISYNWGHQTIMKHICSFLRNSGIKVWMDIDDMHGSTLQAMATAVEKADIVLVCFSQKYKNSDNCRAGIFLVLSLQFQHL